MATVDVGQWQVPCRVLLYSSMLRSPVPLLKSATCGRATLSHSLVYHLLSYPCTKSSTAKITYIRT